MLIVFTGVRLHINSIAVGDKFYCVCVCVYIILIFFTALCFMLGITVDMCVGIQIVILLNYSSFCPFFCYCNT
jgi:hypothetical protein